MHVMLKRGRTSSARGTPGEWCRLAVLGLSWLVNKLFSGKEQRGHARQLDAEAVA